MLLLPVLFVGELQSFSKHMGQVKNTVQLGLIGLPYVRRQGPFNYLTLYKVLSTRACIPRCFKK